MASPAQATPAPAAPAPTASAEPSTVVAASSTPVSPQEPTPVVVPDLRRLRKLYPERPIPVADNAAFAINPMTGRMIRKGGDRYRKLVRAGAIIDPEMLASAVVSRAGRPPAPRRIEVMVKEALNKHLQEQAAQRLSEAAQAAQALSEPRELSPLREPSPLRKVSAPIAIPRASFSRLNNIAEDEPVPTPGVPRLRARSQPRAQPAPERGSLMAREAASFRGLASRMVEASRDELDMMSEDKARAALRARFAALLAS